MQFNHDNMTGVLLSVDLVNLTEGIEPAPTQEVVTELEAELEATLKAHAIRRWELRAVDARSLIAWAHQLRTVFASASTEKRCAAVNELLRVAAANAYLTVHDGLRPHLHFVPEEEDIVRRVRSVTAGGLALFTVEAAGERLHTCARNGCRTVFVDTSRNGRRRYCTARCGNHDAVSRHRANTRADAASEAR